MSTKKEISDEIREKRRISMAKYRQKLKSNKPEYVENLKQYNKDYHAKKPLRMRNPDKYAEVLAKQKEEYQQKKENGELKPQKSKKIVDRELKKRGRKPINVDEIDPNNLTPWMKLKLNNPEKYNELLLKRRERYYKNKQS